MLLRLNSRRGTLVAGHRFRYFCLFFSLTFITFYFTRFFQTVVMAFCRLVYMPWMVLKRLTTKTTSRDTLAEMKGFADHSGRVINTGVQVCGARELFRHWNAGGDNLK